MNFWNHNWKVSAVLTWFHLKFQAQGGDGLLQRIKRIIYDAKSTIVVSFIFHLIRWCPCQSGYKYFQRVLKIFFIWVVLYCIYCVYIIGICIGLSQMKFLIRFFNMCDKYSTYLSVFIFHCFSVCLTCILRDRTERIQGHFFDPFDILTWNWYHFTVLRNVAFLFNYLEHKGLNTTLSVVLKQTFLLSFS